MRSGPHDAFCFLVFNAGGHTSSGSSALQNRIRFCLRPRRNKGSGLSTYDLPRSWHKGGVQDWTVSRRAEGPRPHFGESAAIFSHATVVFFLSHPVSPFPSRADFALRAFPLATRRSPCWWFYSIAFLRFQRLYLWQALLFRGITGELRRL